MSNKGNVEKQNEIKFDLSLVFIFFYPIFFNIKISLQ